MSSNEEDNDIETDEDNQTEEEEYSKPPKQVIIKRFDSLAEQLAINKKNLTENKAMEKGIENNKDNDMNFDEVDEENGKKDVENDTDSLKEDKDNDQVRL